MAVCSNPSPTNVWWATNRIFDERGSLPFISNEINHEQQLTEAIERTDANVIISVQHPHALSNKVLEAVNFKAFNLHSAKLPRYRGSNIANHAILNEEKIYTCTVHWMVPKVDMGDIAFEETFPILDLETAQSLYIKAAQAAIKGFRELLDSLIEGKEPPRVPLGTGGRFFSRKSIDGLKEIRDIRNGPRKLDSALSEIFLRFQAANLTLA